MPGPVDIAQLVQGMDLHLARIQAAQDMTPDPGMQEFVGSLVEKIQAGRDFFQNDYQSKVQEVDQRRAQAAATVEQKKKQCEQMAKKQAAEAEAAAKKAEAAKKAAPTAKEPATDPKLGPRLRRELLQRFAGDELDQTRDLGPREIWEDWDGWSNN